jgi:hypothetical protein
MSMEYERPGNGGSTGFSFQPPVQYQQAAQQQVFQQYPAAAPRAYSGTYVPATDVSVNTPPDIIMVIDIHAGPGIHESIQLPSNIRVGYPYEPRDRCTIVSPSFSTGPTSIEWKKFFQPDDMISRHIPYNFFSQIDNKLLIQKDIPTNFYYYAKNLYDNSTYNLTYASGIERIIKKDATGTNRFGGTNFNYRLKDLISVLIGVAQGKSTAIIMHTCDSLPTNPLRTVYTGSHPGFGAYNSRGNRNMNNMGRSRKNRRNLKRKNKRNTRKN